MRRLIVALSVAAFAAGMGMEAQAAKAPAKSKMGCVIGKEKWDASAGKCMAGKAVKKAPKAAKKAAPKAVKKA